MYAKQEINTEEDHGRKYADRRIYDIYRDHCRKLSEKFTHRPHPKTPQESEMWLKEGKYFFDFPKDEDEEANPEWYHPFDYFKWGSKEWKPDHKSYREAEKALDKLYESTKDIINITTDENKRLEAIQSFEKWKH